ncbi:MAG: GMC family oxidoreductase, partial [Gammaproteobacteria bacterium]|nr:GMC family oxidoreductase [Gammaproteobacteria bacterium]
MPDTVDYEAIIIGSGFGGSVNACRLSRKWPGKVLLLERGKRYPMGSFPRKPHDVSRNFWNINREARKRPGHIRSQEFHGMFDIRNYEHLDAVVCAGLGGGSLIYANVFMEPPDHVFKQGWPSTCNKAQLQPYYDTAKSVLGSRPIPRNSNPRRHIIRTDLYQKVAEKDGHRSRLLDINVFFGNDFENPTPIGQQERNRYGALQTSCVYCAECDLGCNTHSKNTLDLNYLYVAETKYRLTIHTEALGEKIIPLNAAGEDDPDADGKNGYRVVYLDLKNDQEAVSVTCRRIVVSAGTLGTNELLMRCKELFNTLPKINNNLGKGFSANGDFLSFVLNGELPADPNYGPVITQGIDYNLFDKVDRERAFILEDAGYPSFLSWYVEGVKPGVSQLAAIMRAFKMLLARFLGRTNTGRLGYLFNELLRGDLSYTSCVLLCMGIDRSNGTMKLQRNGFLSLDWPYRDSLPLYQAIVDTGKRFRAHIGGKAYLPMPTWLWPARRNVAVHTLGGCNLADSPTDGVTSANPATMGQVFGYRGLYVADGSLIPTALGANPVATISALSERVAEGITGDSPPGNG